MGNTHLRQRAHGDWIRKPEEQRPRDSRFCFHREAVFRPRFRRRVAGECEAGLRVCDPENRTDFTRVDTHLVMRPEVVFTRDVPGRVRVVK